MRRSNYYKKSAHYTTLRVISKQDYTGSVTPNKLFITKQHITADGTKLTSLTSLISRIGQVPNHSQFFLPAQPKQERSLLTIYASADSPVCDIFMHQNHCTE
jgi:hypothetical protein